MREISKSSVVWYRSQTEKLKTLRAEVRQERYKIMGPGQIHYAIAEARIAAAESVRMQNIEMQKVADVMRSFGAAAGEAERIRKVLQKRSWFKRLFRIE